MKDNIQKNAFLNYEADAWFQRNLDVLKGYSRDKDYVIKLLKDYNLEPKSVLEVGCSFGYRLEAIRNLFDFCEVYGIDASSQAINYGKKEFPSIHLSHSTADDLSAFEDGSFDLLIVGFVFYVIDRSVLFKVISEIDRVLKNGGCLIIVDFFSIAAQKNKYHHIKDFDAYSYKQNYWEIFTASKLYCLIGKTTQNQNSKMLDATSDYYNNNSYTILKKEISDGYQ